MSSIFRKVPDTEKNVNSSLYFGNLDVQVTELLLYELFVQFAPIKSLNMPKDRILKTHQGYGFVEFKNSQDADYVLRILNGIRIYGRLLKLKKSEPQKSSTQNGSGNLPNVNEVDYMDVGAKLFINNLNPLIDEEYLSDTFSKFGLIIGAPQIDRDPDTGESKGHGTVTFNDFASSDEVIEKMNGTILMNHKISISYAYKEDPVNGMKKNERHGDEVERLLAENAKSNKLIKTRDQTAKSKNSNKVQKPKMSK